MPEPQQPFIPERTGDEETTSIPENETVTQIRDACWMINAFLLDIEGNPLCLFKSSVDVRYNPATEQVQYVLTFTAKAKAE